MDKMSLNQVTHTYSFSQQEVHQLLALFPAAIQHLQRELASGSTYRGLAQELTDLRKLEAHLKALPGAPTPTFPMNLGNIEWLSTAFPTTATAEEKALQQKLLVNYTSFEPLGPA